MIPSRYIESMARPVSLKKPSTVMLGMHAPISRVISEKPNS